MRLRCLLTATALAVASQSLAADCADWNTGEFFNSATLAEVRDCLEAGAGVGARDALGGTPLHYAAGHNPFSTVISALIAAGAEVEARGVLGTTPLHEAALFGYNLSGIWALTAAGAEVNARTDEGKTPLHLAARFGEKPTVITLLLNAGADATARDNDGDTPWDLIQDNEALRGTDAYWRLNDARFE